MFLVAGPNAFLEKVCCSSLVSRLYDGKHEQHRFQVIVITESAHLCQWDCKICVSISRRRSRQILVLRSFFGPLRAASKKEITNLIVFDDHSLQSNFAQQTQPSCARKQTQNVAIMHRVSLALWIANQDREVNQIRRVGRVGIKDPLQKPHSPAW